jgi:hypothetical protein
MLYKQNAGKCDTKRCLFPKTCQNLIFGHEAQIKILEKVAALPNVKKVFISSGLRYDMICSDKNFGRDYLDTIVENNTSGQMKIVPEHCDDKVFRFNGKTVSKTIQFIEMFKQSSKNKQFLTYYL